MARRASVRASALSTAVASGASSGDDAQELREELTPEEAETLATIDRVRSELGDSEGYVMLSRRQPNGTLATLAKINVTTFEPDYVLRKYGGGVYVARFYKSGVNITEGGFLGSSSFTIDPSVKPEPEPVPATDGNGGGNGDGTGVLVVLVRGMLEELKALRTAPPPPASPPLDPLAMIRELAATAKAMMPPPPALPAGEHLGLKDQLALVSSIVDVGTKIVDARGGGGGGEMESGDAYATIVAKLADPVVELVKDRMQAERRGGRPPASLPARTGAPAPAAPLPAPPPETETTVVPPWALEVRRLLPLIVSRAARGVSAENTAFFVLDDLSDTAKEKIAELAAMPDFETEIMKVLPPPLRQRPEWTGEFIAAIRDYFFPPEDEPEDDDEGSGDDEGFDEEGEGPVRAAAAAPAPAPVEPRAATPAARPARRDPLATRADKGLAAMPEGDGKSGGNTVTP